MSSLEVLKKKKNPLLLCCCCCCCYNCRSIFCFIFFTRFSVQSLFVRWSSQHLIVYLHMSEKNFVFIHLIFTWISANMIIGLRYLVYTYVHSTFHILYIPQRPIWICQEILSLFFLIFYLLSISIGSTFIWFSHYIYEAMTSTATIQWSCSRYRLLVTLN